MSDTGLPTLAVDRRVEVGVYLVGAVAGVAAAYHAGETGRWQPLLAVTMVLTMAVLFLDSPA